MERRRGKLSPSLRDLRFIGLSSAFVLATNASASCLSLTSGAVVYDVSVCRAISPETTFDLSKEKFAWIKELDPKGKQELFNTYRGLLLKGLVVRSKATQTGMNPEKGALEGETAYLYLAPSNPQNPSSCEEINGKRLAGQLKEVCCDGGGDIPCLLGTSFLLQNHSIIGNAGSKAGDAERQKAAQSADYAAGEKAFGRKKYKDAAAAYEKARAKGDLDVRGHYRLGYSYRELDQCREAIAPLKYIFDKQNQKQLWADEEKTARSATFLLARCYSKLGDISNSLYILNSYLIEPAKYRRELNDSLRNKDFGYIHTSKEYRLYKADAEKRLKKR